MPNPGYNADPLGLDFSTTGDAPMPPAYAGETNNVTGVTGSFATGLFQVRPPSPPISFTSSRLHPLSQDLGLIPFGNGQSYDYWTNPPPPASAYGLGGGGGGTDSSSTETSPLDLAAFLGVGASGTSEDATQVLLTQMAGGW